MSSEGAESTQEIIDIPSFVQGLRNLECDILQRRMHAERQERHERLRPTVQKLLFECERALRRQEWGITSPRLSNEALQTFQEMTGISLTLDYYIRDSVKAKYKFNLHGNKN